MYLKHIIFPYPTRRASSLTCNSKSIGHNSLLQRHSYLKNFFPSLYSKCSVQKKARELPCFVKLSSQISRRRHSTYQTNIKTNTSNTATTKRVNSFQSSILKVAEKDQKQQQQQQTNHETTVSLVRDYIADSLYNSKDGYFTTSDCVYSYPETTGMNFLSLWGKLHYIWKLDSLYKSNVGAWFTPVELFRPWYSYAIASWIAQEFTCKRHPTSSNRVLKIYEVGGGNGTNALCILNYFRDNYPSLYENMQYTLIEISPTMANRQRSLVHATHAKERCSIVNKDFLNLKDHNNSPKGVPKQDFIEKDPCFVVALEVFDNLPHDRLVRRWHTSPSSTKKESNHDSSSLSWFSRLLRRKSTIDEIHHRILERREPCFKYNDEERMEWFETVIVQEKSGDVVDGSHYSEVLRPLQDPLAIKAAQLFLGEQKGREACAQENDRYRQEMYRNDTTARAKKRKTNLFRKFFQQRAQKALQKERLTMEANENSTLHPIFVPTGATIFLDTLQECFPQHSLIMADFAELPCPEIRAQDKDMYHSSNNKSHGYKRPPGYLPGTKNMPLVSGSSKSSTTSQHQPQQLDYLTYLVPMGSCDIFFQTDFPALQLAYNQVTKKNSYLVSSRDFLIQYADYAQTRTKSGFNPLLEDYNNTTFLLTKSTC